MFDDIMIIEIEKRYKRYNTGRLAQLSVGIWHGLEVPAGPG